MPIYGIQGPSESEPPLSHYFCQVPIYFEASWLLQTDSEVLPTHSNLTYSLTLNSRTKDGGCYCYLHFISKLLGN